MKKLTDEEIARIMVLRACDYKKKEIAEKMNLGYNTVQRHTRKFNMEAEEESPEETVMHRLSPLATVVIG